MIRKKLRLKDELYSRYSEASDRIHTITQLLKAYTLFEKDDEYVITEDGKIAIVDEFTGRVLPGRRYSAMDFTRQLKQKKMLKLNAIPKLWLQLLFRIILECIINLQV